MPTEDSLTRTADKTGVIGAIIASFGFNTGIGASSAAQASMHGPKAEQVNRIASAPVPAA